MRKQYTMRVVENPKVFLSWGKGLQSSCLGVMAVQGLFHLDGIITADTGWEHQFTNEVEKFYTQYFTSHGIPTYSASKGNIKTDRLNWLNIPFYTSPDGAPLRRQCTNMYKIQPCRRKIRELCNMRIDGKGRSPKGAVKLLLGISYDEAERMKDSTANYIVNDFPLVDMKFSRKSCIDYISNLGLPVPQKSSCVCCPYQGAARWKQVKDEYPEDWKDLVAFDNEHRHAPKSMVDRGHGCDLFLWKKLVPLEEVDWETVVEKGDDKDVCDSGYCFV
jgi:hypothetical protein